MASWLSCRASIGSHSRAYLRAAKAQVTVTLDIDELVQGCQRPLRCRHHRTPAGGRTGDAARVVGASDARELARYPVVLGLWKGDLTLKRAISAAMARLQKDGQLAAIVAATARVVQPMAMALLTIASIGPSSRAITPLTISRARNTAQ